MNPADFRGSSKRIAAKGRTGPRRMIPGRRSSRTEPVEAPARRRGDGEGRGDDRRASPPAGFTKLHLDTRWDARANRSRCDEPTAERAARLAVVAEAHTGAVDPVYVIGTEVPVPRRGAEELDELAVRDPRRWRGPMRSTARAFAPPASETAFYARDRASWSSPASSSAIRTSIHFRSGEGREPSPPACRTCPGIVFEAHSTDYQTEAGLSRPRAQRLLDPKVGPWR